MSEPVLQVTGLTKIFGDAVAVDDVSFAVAEGGALAIVGESGSGKTTIARMLVGLTRPTAGQIRACGRDRSVPARRTAERRRRAREMQIVFQDPYASLDPRRSTAQVLEEALRVQRRPAAEPDTLTVAGLGELVGLSVELMRARPRALSGGQRQRVAIARALAGRPSILVLDEPVAALDVSIQAQILNLLTEIRETTGVSYVFITHDLAVVRQVCDEVLVLRQGRVVETGPTEDVLDDPRHEYTKRLLASVPGASLEARSS